MGKDDCILACEEAQCCFEFGGGNCYNEKTEWCDLYTPCELLRELPIDEACTESAISTDEGKEKCATLCMKRGCCFKTGDDNCADLDPEWCNEYMACKILYSGPVDDACTDENIVTDEGRIKCTELCMKRSCCFAQGEDSCYSLEPSWCDEYSACKILYGFAVDDACSKENVATSEGEEECTELCAERSCCFASGFDSCYDLEWEWCDEYEACNILYGGPVSEACTEENVATFKGIKLCADLCTKRSCCFTSGSDNCYHDKKEWCDEYSACKNLHDMSPQSTPGETSNMDTSNMETSNMSVDDSCTDEKIMTDEGRSNCVGICVERSCCFLSGSANCYSEKQEWCDEYSACKKVFVNVNDACTKEKISTDEGRLECEGLCLERSCCFLPGPDNCYSEKAGWCDEYSACKILHENEATVTDTNTNNKVPDQIVTNLGNADFNIFVKETCGETFMPGKERKTCEEHCIERYCCYVDDASSCYHKHSSWCNEFSVCNTIATLKSKFELKDDQISEENFIQLVKNSCEANFMAGKERKQCEERCIERFCCFIPSKASCYDSKKEWCDEYSICNSLPVSKTKTMSNANENVPNSDETDEIKQSTNKNDNADLDLAETDFDVLVRQTCGEAFMSAEDRQKCEERCMERYCCYLDGATSCYDANPSWCDEFGICNTIGSSKDKFELKDDQISEENFIIIVEDLCAVKFKSEKEREQCNEHCIERFCCFIPSEASCYNANKDWCDEYSICNSLPVPETEPMSNANENVPNTEETDNSITLLLDACSDDMLITSEGREDCKSLCSERECCFLNPPNCFFDDPAYCNEYSICEKVYAVETDNKNDDADLDLAEVDFSALVKETCGEAFMYGEDRDKCEERCMERYCCYLEGATSCYDANPSWCDEFDICNTIGSSKDKFELKDDQISEETYFVLVEDTCGIKFNSEKERELCKDRCIERFCCFIPSEASCYDANKDWCDEYSICNSLPVSKPLQEENNSIKNDDGEILLGNLDQVCSEQNVKTFDGREACQAVCEERKCCFSLLQDNCYLGSEEWCDEYKVCKNLQPGRYLNSQFMQAK